MLLFKTSCENISKDYVFICCVKQTNTCKYNLQNIQISFDINQKPMNVKHQLRI